jgi:glycosyltransferase involved in cell wall biosynthesis
VGNPAPDARCQRGLRRKWAFILALSRALKVSVVSASGYIERSMRTLGNMPGQSRVVTYGCRTEEIFTRACDSRSKRCPRGPVSIGMISRLDPIKDHKTLIRAFAKLTEMVETNVVLKIVGDGVTRPECMRLCEELGIVDRVIFLGNRSDIPEQLGTLDIFAFATTRDEGFGIVLIEALAAGVPIVASDVGACREVLENGNLGILIPEKNVDALCGQLASLVRRAPVPIDRAVLARARELYDITCTTRRHLELFEDLRSSVLRL